MEYQQIGQSFLDKYQITLDVNSSCWKRPHAHCDTRKICKMPLPKTRYSLFDFLHECGHIVHPQGGYRHKTTPNPASTRFEAEYNATKWAKEQFHIMGIQAPLKKIRGYNRYVKSKIGRAMRRGLKRLPSKFKRL